MVGEALLMRQISKDAAQLLAAELLTGVSPAPLGPLYRGPKGAGDTPVFVFEVSYKSPRNF